MDSILSSNVLFQFFAGAAALLALLIQFKWSDKRTNSFKYLRNSLFVISFVLFVIGIGQTIRDNNEKAEAEISLQSSFDSVKHNFDSIKLN